MDSRIPEPDSTASVETRVNLKRAQLFINHAAGNAFSFILGAVIIASTLYISHVHPYVIATWCSAILVVTAGILYFQFFTAKVALHAGNTRRLINIRMALGAGIGLLYGIAPFTLPETGTQLPDMFLFIILSSFVAIAMLSYSVMPRYNLLLNFTVMGLLLVHYLIKYINGGEPYYALLIFSSLLWQTIFVRKSLLSSKSAIEGMALYERLQDETISKTHAQHLAMHDELTGLPNRRYFVEMSNHILHATERRDARMGIIILDLNNFKAFNDDYGHETGDKVLQRFAEHIRENIRGSDFAARMGGDEFIVMTENLESDVSLAHLMFKLQKTISLQLEENQVQLQINSSIGHAIYPIDGTTLQQLLHIADQRMYQHKRAAKAASQSH